MKRFLRILTLAFGIILTALGVIGLFLPFLQGVLFIVLGLYIVSISSPRFEAWLDRALSRFPRVHSRYHSYRLKIDAFWAGRKQGRAEKATK